LLLQVLHDVGLGGVLELVPEPAAGTAGIAGIAGTAPAAGAASSGPSLMVPRITASTSRALKLEAKEVADMVEALQGPLYTTLKSRTLIALLVRLNEYVMAAVGASYVKPYTAADK